MTFVSFFSGVISGMTNPLVTNPSPSAAKPSSIPETDMKTNETAIKVLAVSRSPDLAPNIGPQRILPFCPHNERGETTVSDIAEHVGNSEFGSAVRDAVESDFGQAVSEAVQEAIQTIGDEMIKDN